MILITAAVATPLLGLAGWLGQSWLAVGLALTGLALIALLDALIGRNLSRGISVSLEGSRHATQGRPIDITAQITGPPAKLRVAIAWPDGCETTHRILETKTSGANHPVTWHITPHQRGNITIGQIHYEAISPLGLWALRHHAPADLNLRVFPALLEDRGVLAPLFLRRPAAGLHVVRQVGKGREFEQLREYLPGDSYEDIYWKGTARRGHPVTKIHQIERTQDVYIVVDASRRSLRRLTAIEAPGQAPTTQMDRFVRAAMALSLTALQQGDRPGLAVFGPTLRHFLRAAGGQPQYAAFRDSLYDLHARPDPPDFADVFADLGNRLRQRALLLFLTDLDDPVLADQFCEEIKSFARRHVVLVGQLQSPGIAPVFANRQSPPATDTDAYARLAGHMLWQGARQTGNRLRSQGIHWVSSPSESLVAEMVSSYLNIKRRQLL
jgi:uncharacterized protein (DUF58 family)